MAEIVMSSLLKTLNEAFIGKLRESLVTDVKKIDKVDVQEKLRLWLPVLKDLDARKSKNLSVYNLERDIRDLVYRLEDVLETYFNMAQSRKGRSKIRNFIDDFKYFRMVALEIQEINTRIISNIEVLKNLNILAVTNIEEERSLSANENPETQNLRYRIPDSAEKIFVGMEDELQTLSHILLDGKFGVICIYGMGGAGKTTLAQKLYYMTYVQDYFHMCAWVNMGHDIIMENVLGNMLNQLLGGGDRINLSDLTTEKLAEQVYKTLKGRRYLVVLDDIWSLTDWDFLRRIFPNDQNGSKLMLTSRLREIASYVAGDDRDGFIHAKRILSTDESSLLFWKTAFLGDPQEVDSFKKQIGEEVLKLCKGLSSAIVAAGKVLATKHTLREWEMVLQDMKSLMSRGLPVDQIILEQPISALSFDDLPYHLKPCFLYFGMFPKGSKIEVEHLYLLWMAEGMISLDDCQNNETVMDLAERCLSNLVQRQLVEVEEEEIPSFRKYKSCWVHQHMQDHCLLKGKEYFFKVLDFGLRTQRTNYSFSSSSIIHPARRMGIHFGQQDDSTFVDQFKNEIVNHLRSLLFLNTHDLQTKLEGPRGMFKYRMLRVLNFERVDFQERGLPWGIKKLIYLRYLSFKGCILGEFPSSMGNLSFLETLDLRVSSRIIIPNVLRKMEKLVYLYLPLMFRTPNNDKLYLGSLEKLETLENFDTSLCNVTDLFKMTNLRYLSMTVEGNLGDLEQIVHRMDMTPGHASVLYPSIKIKNFDCYTEERHSVFRKLLNCQVLHTLYMDGHLGTLPPHHKITPTLNVMVLIGSQLKEDPMTTLDKLPELQVLVLQDDAFDGKKMVCVESSFKKLKRLQLLTLRFLETWEVEEGSMPMLSTLAVENCRKLRSLPQELMERVQLQISRDGL